MPGATWLIHEGCGRLKPRKVFGLTPLGGIGFALNCGSIAVAYLEASYIRTRAPLTGGRPRRPPETKHGREYYRRGPDYTMFQALVLFSFVSRQRMLRASVCSLG